MKIMNTSLLCALAIASGVGGAFLAEPLLHTHAARAGQIRPMWEKNYPTLESMTADVDAVVIGTVTGSVLGRVVPTADSEGLPFTFVDIKVEQTLRGSAPENVTLEQTGGRLDSGILYSTDDGGSYVTGDRVLLFLKAQPDTGLYYLAHPKGRFSIRQGILESVVPDDSVAQMLHHRSVRDVRRLMRR